MNMMSHLEDTDRLAFERVNLQFQPKFSGEFVKLMMEKFEQASFALRYFNRALLEFKLRSIPIYFGQNS